MYSYNCLISIFLEICWLFFPETKIIIFILFSQYYNVNEKSFPFGFCCILSSFLFLSFLFFSFSFFLPFFLFLILKVRNARKNVSASGDLFFFMMIYVISFSLGVLNNNSGNGTLFWHINHRKSKVGRAPQFYNFFSALRPCRR